MSENGGPPLITVSEALSFDEAALKAYLSDHLAGFSGDLQVRQFNAGQSNPTYQLTAGGRKYVLRKKPPGTLLPSAHAVDREYRVMHALRDTPVPVPKMLHLCTDPSVIGTEFYVMEMVEGRVFHDPSLPGLTPPERRAFYESFIKALAELHAVEPEAVGLGDFGRPEGYLSRQVARWTKQYKATETETIAAMDKLMDWLPANLPADDEAAIVHGDFRPGNAIVRDGTPEVSALLDWELCTLGHPLADLGYGTGVFGSLLPLFGARQCVEPSVFRGVLLLPKCCDHSRRLQARARGECFVAKGAETGAPRPRTRRKRLADCSAEPVTARRTVERSAMKFTPK